MTYVEVRRMLTELVAAQEQFYRWAADQHRQASDPQSTAILKKLQSNAAIRLDALREAATESDPNTLATELQYDSSDDLEDALEALPPPGSDNLEGAMAAASRYHQTMIGVLRQAQRDSEASPASVMFAELAEQTEAVAVNDAWNSRGLP